MWIRSYVALPLIALAIGGVATLDGPELGRAVLDAFHLRDPTCDSPNTMPIEEWLDRESMKQVKTWTEGPAEGPWVKGTIYVNEEGSEWAIVRQAYPRRPCIFKTGDMPLHLPRHVVRDPEIDFPRHPLLPPKLYPGGP